MNGNSKDNINTGGDTPWTLVGGKRRLKQATKTSQNEPEANPVRNVPYNRVHTERSDKITEPCWFYNNGGCRHKDGTEKTAEECKYLHLYSDNVKRPPHLSTKKPCDKFNLEGECKWHDNCKYSHRNLSPDEWSRFYPGIPYTLRTNIQKRVQLENKLNDVEGRMKVTEFKQDGMSRDIQQIGQTLQQCVRQLKILIDRTEKMA